MNSSLPKVLHPIADKSMLQHVLDTTQSLKAKKNIVVYGHGKADLEKALSGQNVELAYQAEQLGTGHAVKQALPLIDDNDSVLILYADTPLVSKETLDKLVQHYPENGIALLTVKLDDPTGYGRILRDNDAVVGIVEQKDATKDQLAINEVNTGIMLVSGKQLRKWLNQLNNNNQQKEYYLTDIIGFAYQDGCEIATSHPSSEIEVEGVNNRLQQAKLERYYQFQQAEKLMLAGVTLKDPNRFDLRGVLNHGKDVIIDTNVVIEGDVTLGDNVTIESGVILKNCTIGNDCIISAYSVIENASLDVGCTVGPFARLRPGADLKAKAHVGNFVEIKNAVLGEGSKAGHLSYLGDSEIGTEVNIGAGTITCNYDGANKHKTIIGDRVFVGSDTQLVAPVTVGNDVTIAAGTTVTKNVSEGALVLSRVKQSEIQGWKRPQKNKK